MRAYPFAWPFLLLGLSACLEECAPGTVAEAVGRLSVRNFGALATAVSDDTRCGFSSPSATQTMDGVVGSEGTVTLEIRDCELDFSEPVTTQDCSGVKTTLSGRVTVSGRRSVTGRLTGDPDRPVIPTRSEAVRVELHVRPERFRVESDGSALTWISGQLTGTVYPRLGLDAATGVCSIPTPIARFEELAYAGAVVFVEGEGRAFEVPVASSDISAWNGEHPDASNAIRGVLEVWEGQETLESSLDPEYDAKAQYDSFACKLGNVDASEVFACDGKLEQKIADGGARLTIQALGTIVDLVDKNTDCGLSSASVLGAARTEGEVGGRGVVHLETQACRIELPEGHVASRSCDGVESKASGVFVVSAHKVLEGRLTGDEQTPVIPMSDTPARIELRVESLNEFRVVEGETGIRVHSGGLSAVVIPRVARDASQRGACAFETPIARFEDVKLSGPLEVTLKSASGEVPARFDALELTAVNGSLGGLENELVGSVTLGGQVYAVPSRPGLDPDYDPAQFARSWQCGSLEMPVSHECAFVNPIAEGAGQLSVLTLATLAEYADGRASCGFGSVPARVSTEAGRSQAEWVVHGCELFFPEPTKVAEDCLGHQTFVRGRVRLSGSKVVRGVVTNDLLDPILPDVRDAASVAIDASFQDFEVWEAPDAKASRLTLHSGNLRGVVRPRLAIDTHTGACALPTDVAEIELSHEHADLTVASEGKVFRTTLGESNLRAVAGERDGEVNRIAGAMVVDGQSLTLDSALDPEFGPVSFLDGFSCVSGFGGIPDSDARCDPRVVMGQGAARLLIQAAGTLASRVNADDHCGFEALRVKTRPDQVVGDPGDMGMMHWTISGCELSGMDDGAPDCLGRRTYSGGQVDVRATREVTGRRERVLLLVDSIKPASPDAVRIELVDAAVSHFSVYDLDPREARPDRRLTLESGRLSAVVQPVLGERTDEPGTFDIVTPVAVLSGVKLAQAHVVLESEGKSFSFEVTGADLRAVHGSYGQIGEENVVEGSIVVDGLRVDLDALPLDPDFDQGDFDARYACTENLRALVAPVAP